MTLLEESYRWWLRLLPAWYRLDREDEMVATFMEAAGSGADAEIAQPSWAEIRGRAGAGRPDPAGRRRGRAPRASLG